MKKTRISKILKYVAGVITALILVYVTLLTVRVVSGVSQTTEVPDNLLRVRVLDAGTSDAQALADRLTVFDDPEISIQIVEVAKFNVRDLPYSFIISHSKDKTSAVKLARRLGIDPTAVIYKPLEHNTKQVSATLVAGADMDRIISKFLSKKEK